jgi:hypothetical protein
MSADLHLGLQLNGTPVFLGVIVATTTKNNHDTASAFNNTGIGLGGKMLLIQSDAACFILPGTANTATATSSNGVKLAADERVVIIMDTTASYGWLAAVSVSGTANVRVWELIDPS